MQRLPQMLSGLTFSLALLLVTVSTAQDAVVSPPAAPVPPPALEFPDSVVVQPPKLKNLPLSEQSHGIRLDAAGRLSGVTATIDPSVLELVREPEIDVIFVQQGRIIAQARSNTNGQFVVNGLTPHAVYSVIARSAHRTSNGWYSAFSVAVFPALEQVVATNRDAQFTSLVKQSEVGDALSDVLTISAIPSQDLAAVGLPLAFPDRFAPGGPMPFGYGGAGAGAGGGGSGGGGGGGAGGGGFGGLAAAAGLAAALAASSQDDLASPFAP